MIICGVFFFQAEDGIRDLVRSRGLGDVYKRQVHSTIEPSYILDCLLPTISLATNQPIDAQCPVLQLSLIHI